MSNAFFRLKSKIRNTRHHFRSANWSKLHRYEHLRSGKKHLPWLSLLRNSWRYGADFEENYVLDFFNLSEAQIHSYITRSVFFEFCEQVNQYDKTPIIRDKWLYSEYFRDLLGRNVWCWSDVLNFTDADPVPERLVVKNRWGRRGEEVYFLETQSAPWSQLKLSLPSRFQPPEHYVFEEFIEQHPHLTQLNPGSLNSVRLYTFLESLKSVKIWCMFLRVGVGPGPDTLTQGGLGFKLDENGKTSYPCITNNPYTQVPEVHPLTHEPLLGFQLPHFEAMKELACQSARRLPEIRVNGWDIAIKPDGPCLIEGNDRGDHMHFQKFLQRGCLDFLSPYCDFKVY